MSAILDELRAHVRKLPTSVLILGLIDPGNFLDEVADLPKDELFKLGVELIAILRTELDARVPPSQPDAEVDAAIEQGLKEEAERMAERYRR